MYAGDIILFSETFGGLQSMLDTILLYTNKWGMTVNTSKINIVVFRNGSPVKNDEIWYYDGNIAEIVDEFCY